MLQIHDRLGDFEIIRRLGKGGMGEVYEARQFNPDRRVAVKVLVPWLANDDEALQRFWREAAVPANLDHPGIVRIISTGKTPSGIAYYAMHLVRGVSLADMIGRGNVGVCSDAVTRSVETVDTPSLAPHAPDNDVPASPPPAMETSPPMLADYRTDRFTTLARIGAQAARALAYAHFQGHLHRDIKPSNLMVDHHDQVYLVDFGLTRGLEPGGSGTQSGVVIGTPWYMSPEQAEGKPLDARSDIYSLGVTLYELATQGLGPFTANRDNKKSVLTQVRAGQVLPLRPLAPGIPPELERIIQRAMHLRPHKRYAAATDLAKELEAYLGIPSKHTPHPARQPENAPHRRWPIRVGAAAALVALVVAAAVYFYRPQGGNKEDLNNPGVTKRQLDGTQALPESLRDKRNLRVALPLLNNAATPLWSERLLGDGKLSPLKSHFLLPANTILALADPDRPNFELALELAQLKSNDDMGIFFGWQRRAKDSSDPYRFFVIKWDNHPVGGDLHGRITIGTAWLVKGNDTRADSLEWLKPLPEGKGTLALAPRTSNNWPVLTLNVQGEHITVSVPNRKPLVISLAELKRTDPDKYQDLRATGEVGVWTKNGVGLFRNAKVTPLPGE